jgi:hypothetical protein
VKCSIIPTAAAADRWFGSQIFMKPLIPEEKICELQRPHASASGAVGIIRKPVSVCYRNFGPRDGIMPSSRWERSGPRWAPGSVLGLSVSSACAAGYDIRSHGQRCVFRLSKIHFDQGISARTFPENLKGSPGNRITLRRRFRSRACALLLGAMVPNCCEP